VRTLPAELTPPLVTCEQSVVCGANSSAVLGSDDTAYLLGTWDGLSNYVPFVKSKYGAVRKSQKGTTPDVLETPLGIDEAYRPPASPCLPSPREGVLFLFS